MQQKVSEEKGNFRCFKSRIAQLYIKSGTQMNIYSHASKKMYIVDSCKNHLSMTVRKHAYSNI